MAFSAFDEIPRDGELERSLSEGSSSGLIPAMPYVGVERRSRNTDRRGGDRPGKQDRRQNTCGKCQHFSAMDLPQGQCQKHLKPFLETDFACVWFSPKG